MKKIIFLIFIAALTISNYGSPARVIAKVFEGSKQDLNDVYIVAVNNNYQILIADDLETNENIIYFHNLKAKAK